MEKITITKEMLLQAADYVENALKDTWVSDNAPKCFDKLTITSDDEPMPPMYMVNIGIKNRYLMGAFVGFYLKQPFNTENGNMALMTEQDYDKWAGSHVYNQVERWKRDAELRDKCYDLLADYKDIEKRFSAQLNGLLTVQNDSVIRQNDFTANQMKQLPELLEQLKELQGKVETDGAESQ